MADYYVKINEVPLTKLDQFENILSKDPVTLEVIINTNSKLISEKFTGKILRSGEHWFKFYYDIEQGVKEEVIPELDFVPGLELMIWNEGFETGRMLIEAKGGLK